MNVPKLRFKEFDGEWEEQKLGDITEKIGSGKTPKGGKATYQTEGIALIRSQNIFNDQVNSNDIAYISTETDESMKNSRVFNGDILLNITGASIGRSAVYKKDVIANVNQHVCIIRPKKDYSSDFIQLNISSNKGQKEIEFNQAGGGREGLNFQQIAKMKFNYPSIKEQNKISLLFEKLNKKIQLQQQKIDLLQEQKKGFLQKMFPKAGETQPEMRFDGFMGDWEQRKLGDYLSIPKKEKIKVVNTDELMTLKLNLGGIQCGTSRETLELGSTVYYKRSAGQFIYGKQNFFNGSMAIIPSELDGKATSGDVPSLDISNINADYLYTYVSRKDYWKCKESAASGTGSKRIHESILLEFEISVPNMAEQQKISIFFKKLDEIITLHQQKLNLYKKQKKGFMQQMFI